MSGDEAGRVITARRVQLTVVIVEALVLARLARSGAEAAAPALKGRPAGFMAARGRIGRGSPVTAVSMTGAAAGHAALGCDRMSS